MNKGFTLVELAIVIVIIGGVIGGRSLIESAKINSVISDIDKYKTAINAFKLEYDALPGDMPDATDYWGQAGDGSASECLTVSGTGTETCNGDNDKTFDYVSITNSPHEPWRAWEHLSNAEIIKGNYTGVRCTLNTYCTDPNVNVPESMISGTTWMLLYLEYAGWKGKKKNRNVLALGSPKNKTSSNYSNRWYGLALTTKQQKSIDKKVDDGKPNRGQIVDMNNDGISSGAYDPNCVTGINENMEYNLTYTDVACLMFVDLD